MKIKGSSLVLGLIHLSFFLNVAIFAISNGKDSGHLLWGLIIVILITSWCTIDAKDRKFPLPHAYQFIIFLLTPIGWPLYALSSRGVVKGLKFIALQLLIFILDILIVFIIGILIHGHNFMIQ